MFELPYVEAQGEEDIVQHSQSPSIRLIEHAQCDRKRPCQRCIQLGLVRISLIAARYLDADVLVLKTGLCVYEVDDPALR